MSSIFALLNASDEYVPLTTTSQQLTLDLRRRDHVHLEINEFLSLFGQWICKYYDDQVQEDGGQWQSLTMEQLLVRLVYPLLSESDQTFPEVVNSFKMTQILPLSEYTIEWALNQVMNSSDCCRHQCNKKITVAKGRSKSKKQHSDDDTEYENQQVNSDDSDAAPVEISRKNSSASVLNTLALEKRPYTQEEKFQALITKWLDQEDFVKHVGTIQNNLTSNLSLGQDRYNRHYYMFSHTNKIWLRSCKLDSLDAVGGDDEWFECMDPYEDVCKQLTFENEFLTQQRLYAGSLSIGQNLFDYNRVSRQTLSMQNCIQHIAQTAQLITQLISMPHTNDPSNDKYSHFESLSQWEPGVEMTDIPSVKHFLEVWYKKVTASKKQRRNDFSVFSPMLFAFSDHDILEVSAADLKRVTQAHGRWLSLVKKASCIQQIILYLDLLHETIIINVEGEPSYQEHQEKVSQ